MGLQWNGRFVMALTIQQNVCRFMSRWMYSVGLQQPVIHCICAGFWFWWFLGRFGLFVFFLFSFVVVVFWMNFEFWILVFCHLSDCAVSKQWKAIIALPASAVLLSLISKGLA